METIKDLKVVFIMPPTLKKWGAYCFRLVRLFVCPFVRSSVCPSVQKNFKARVLKFHIWIPHQKIAYNTPIPLDGVFATFRNFGQNDTKRGRNAKSVAETSRAQ